MYIEVQDLVNSYRRLKIHWVKCPRCRGEYLAPSVHLCGDCNPLELIGHIGIEKAVELIRAARGKQDGRQ